MSKFSILSMILLAVSSIQASAQTLENGVYDTSAGYCSFRLVTDAQNLNMVVELVDSPRARCGERGRILYFTYRDENSFVLVTPLQFPITKRVLAECDDFIWCHFFRDPETKKPIAIAGDIAEARIVFKGINSRAFIYDQEARLMRGENVLVDWTFQNDPNLFSKRGTGYFSK